MSKGILAFGLCSLLMFSAFIPISFGYKVRSVDNETEYWALLIAVGVYADNPNQNRPQMLDQIDDLYDVLLASPSWQNDNIRVIKGEGATVYNIIKGLKWLDKMEDSNDISLIYFSTHGGPCIRDFWPWDEADGYDEALKSYWGFSYPSAYIRDDVLNYYLNNLESKGVCLIVSSCHSGGFNDVFNFDKVYRDRRPSSTWMTDFVEDLSKKNRVILTSCQEDELSYGFFTPFIIDGLRGHADVNMDSIVSAEELFFYSKPRTELTLFWISHPMMYDGYLGELPLAEVPENIRSLDKNYNGYSSYKLKKYFNDFFNGSFLDENSVLCGYVNKSLTGDPFKNAIVLLEGTDNQGNSYYNYTSTDSSGFYSMNIKPGNFLILCHDEDYEHLFEFLGQYKIRKYETVWVNASLLPCPPKNSVICGYITDSQTNEPIKDAHVYIMWIDNFGHWWSFDTESDNHGFYNINIFSGEIYFDSHAVKYCWKRSFRNDVKENETLWSNISLIKNTLKVNITKPLRAFYIMNNRIIPSSKALIFGDIEISAFVHDPVWCNPIKADKVEFYINDELKSTDTEFPFSWMLRSKKSSKYTIKVIAYDDEGNTATDELDIWKFF